MNIHKYIKPLRYYHLQVSFAGYKAKIWWYLLWISEFPRVKLERTAQKYWWRLHLCQLLWMSTQAQEHCCSTRSLPVFLFTHKLWSLGNLLQSLPLPSTTTTRRRLRYLQITSFLPPHKGSLCHMSFTGSLNNHILICCNYQKGIVVTSAQKKALPKCHHGFLKKEKCNKF